MKQSKFLLTFLIFILFCNSSFSQTNEKAPKFGPERIRKCDDVDHSKIHDTDTLNINFNLNFASQPDNGLGSDFMFEMSNPYCYSYFTGYWWAFRTAIFNATLACGGTPTFLPNPLKDIIRQAINLAKCSSEIVRTKNPFNDCCLANAAVVTAGAIATAQAGIISDRASKTLTAVRVCGYNWSQPTYKSDPILGDSSDDDLKEQKKISYKQYLLKSTKKKYKEEEEFSNSGRYFNINDVISRNPNPKLITLIAQNIEDEDCSDAVLTRMKPFYLRGLDPGNFNCLQYDDGTPERKCCNSLAKNYICLEDIESNEDPKKRNFVFCKKGTTCSIYIDKLPFPTEFMIKEREEGRILCAESHSLCPYNFSVAGGTTYPVKQQNHSNVEEANKKLKDAFITPEANNEDLTTYTNDTLPEDMPCKGSQNQEESSCFSNDNAYQLKNQCQYYAHCTSTSDVPYTIHDRKINRYFSYACLDFKGLAGNKSKSTVILGNEIYLSAPISQCFYETFGNIFINRNGHTLCRNGETTDGTACSNYSEAVYEKNQSSGQNIFTKIQDNLKFTIRVALTLAVLFFGIKILISPGDVIGMSQRKEIILLIFKIGIVAYFSLGNAWQSIFFDAIYGSFPELVSKFFQYTSAQGDMCRLENSTSVSDAYSYLKIFNLLDCKLKYYLAFTPGTSTANIFGLIISTLVTGSYGFLIAISLFFFVIMMIIIIMRALYLFITSALAIVVYIFISPVIFPTLLFKQTTDIFNKWLMQLISFVLQPIILFVYIAIFIQVSDLLILGKDPTFTNDGGKIDCQYDYAKDRKKAEEDQKRLACVLQFNSFKTDSTFSIISVGLPVATMLFSDLLSSGKMGIIFTVLRGAIGIYLLLKMFDLIPGIIDYIFGSSLDKKGEDVLNTFKSFVNKVSLANKMAGSLVWNKAFDIAEGSQGKKDEGKKDEGKKDEDSGVA